MTAVSPDETSQLSCRDDASAASGAGAADDAVFGEPPRRADPGEVWRGEPATGAALWGAPARALFTLDADTRYLNHGAYGATPRAIQAGQADWRARMERNPARFFMRELPGALRQAADAVADFVGTDPERLGFVVNATEGVATVVRGLALEPGDEIVVTDHQYNAVRQLLAFAAAATGARVVTVPLGMPIADPAVVTDAIGEAIGARTRLVIVDHVASGSAVTFPVAAVAALCRARAVPLLVDGAHAPGLLDLDVDAIGADYYVGNGHKWLCGAKSAAFVAVGRSAAPVHPLAISHAYGQGFAPEFDKQGTRDMSAVLTLPLAVALHRSLGGPALRDRNRDLALAAAEDAAAALGTGLGAVPSAFQSMVTVSLPAGAEPTREGVARLGAHLYDAHGIEAAFTTLAGAVWLRISAQVYNEAADYRGLGAAVAEAVALERGEGGA
ncbi:aminotransferase class V-fold PLP-dependent enzyme [Acuticoccus sediminis]|uniref:aminotransferase class V-fold PLP-dependent enzyme n=1 Tax=Acuticoccus sediminis TaxID=2184697 RepID=UPI0011B9415C|nr:aminotransferase class V-fold PLP-dependent enzyme [Acuticoccus sediminis]